MIHQIKTFKLRDFYSRASCELEAFDNSVNNWVNDNNKEVEIIDIKKETFIIPYSNTFSSMYVVSISYAKKTTKELLTEKIQNQ